MRFFSRAILCVLPVALLLGACGATGGSIPADWPADVSVYPGAEVTMSRFAESSGILNLTVADTPEKVHAYYSKQLAADGWAMGFPMVDDNMIVLGGDKDVRHLSVQIIRDGAKTGVNLVLGKKGS